MKKMKFLIVLTFLLLIGCGKDPKDILKDATEAMSELESYYMVIDTDLTYTSNDSSFTIHKKQEDTFDFKNGNGLTEETLVLFETEGTEKIYKVYNDDKEIIYSSYFDESEWKSNVIEFEKPVVFKLLENAEKVKKTNKNNYEITLTKEQIETYFKDMLEVEQFNIDIESFVIKVTLNNGYVTKIVINMPLTLDDNGKITYVNFSATYDTSRFNEVTVVLPKR